MMLNHEEFLAGPRGDARLRSPFVKDGHRYSTNGHVFIVEPVPGLEDGGDPRAIGPVVKELRKRAEAARSALMARTYITIDSSDYLDCCPACGGGGVLHCDCDHCRGHTCGDCYGHGFGFPRGSVVEIAGVRIWKGYAALIERTRYLEVVGRTLPRGRRVLLFRRKDVVGGIMAIGKEHS